MCGRYILTSDTPRLADFFAMEIGPKLIPRYNIAPTQPVPAIRVRKDTGARRLELLYWGLVPQWAKDPSIGNRMINARSETAANKPAYRAAMKYRRCLLPSDGFYEWEKREDGTKQPHLVRMADGEPFALAGLWEQWQDEEGNELDSCTVLTTEANEMMAELHHRMPVILPREAWDRWLDPGEQHAKAVQPLLRPFPSELMTHHPVSPHVNNPRHEDPQCIAPIEG